MCGVPYLGDSYNAKMVCFGERAMELCMREKAVFFLPVNILTVWSPVFLATRHTTVCLDEHCKFENFTYHCISTPVNKLISPVYPLVTKRHTLVVKALLKKFQNPTQTTCVATMKCLILMKWLHLIYKNRYKLQKLSHYTTITNTHSLIKAKNLAL